MPDRLAPGILSCSFLLGAWALLSYGGFVDPFFLPTPSSVLFTLADLLSENSFWNDIVISVSRVLVAFGASAVLAIPIGILMATTKRLSSALEPPVEFIRYLPVPALVPLCILWFGVGEVSKVVVLMIGTFFQLVLLVADDASNLPEEYRNTALTLGTPSRSLRLRVVLPASLPSIYDDLRITLGWCWTYLLIAELVAARSGIGFVIQQAQRYAQPKIMIAGILTIGTIGLMTDTILKRLKPMAFPYLDRT